MIPFIRIWWNTRWFMKHWQVNRSYARYCALNREKCLSDQKRLKRLFR